MITTDKEVASGTAKVATALEKGLPLVSELFVQDAIKYGAVPADLSKYRVDSDDADVDYSDEEEEKPKKKKSQKATLDEADAAQAKKANGPSAKCLAGVVFAISGTLSKPRKEIEKQIAKYGGKLAGSVTNAVQILLCSEEEFENGSDKIEAAFSKDVPILNERFLNDWIDSGVKPKTTRPRYLLGDDAFMEDSEEEGEGDGEEKDEEEAEEPEEEQEELEEDDDEDDDEDDGDDEEDNTPFPEPEEANQANLDLDPKLKPYDGPCLWYSFPADHYRYIFQFLTFKEIMMLYKTGSRALRNTFRIAPMTCLTLRFTNPTKLKWPSCFKYFRNVTEWKVLGPKEYEHMPIQGFSPADFPGSLKRLTMSFGNACDFYKNIDPRDSLPNLQSLTISGQQIDPQFLTVSSKKPLPKGAIDIAYLSSVQILDVERLEMRPDDVIQLPRGLQVLKHLVFNQGGKAPKLVEHFVMFPSTLHTLHVSAGKHGGFLFAHLRYLNHYLASLHVSCTLNTDDEAHPLNDTTFAHLSHEITDLKLAIDGSAEGTGLTKAAWASLPPKLTSLVVTSWPFEMTGQEAVHGISKELVTLRLPDLTPTDDLSWMGELPSTLLDLRLWAKQAPDAPDGGAETMFKVETVFSLLPPNLTRLEMNFDRKFGANVSAKLPRSLTDLRVHCCTLEEEDAADFPPGLKRFSFYSNYEFVYIPLKWMPPGLEEFECLGDCDWEGDEMKWPPNLRSFTASSSNFCDDFIGSFPKSLKRFHMPRDGDASQQNGEYFAVLPRQLTSLHWYFDESMECEPEHAQALPRFLVSLKMSVQQMEKKAFKKLPKTLKELIISEYEEGNVPIKRIKKLLPAHCRLIVQPAE